jgi:mycothiol synthase
MAVFDGATMVGYSLLFARATADPVHQMFQIGGVHPGYRRRGLGGRLLGWAENAAPALHRDRFPGRPLSLRGHCATGDLGALALFSGRGYQAERYFHEMTCDLSGERPEAPAPAGIQIVGFTAERSADALLVRNEAFRHNWGATEASAGDWAHRIGLPSFRAALSFIAYADAEPAGIVIGEERLARAGAPVYYILIVATREGVRRRGVASALLAGALTTASEAGFGTARLNVDAASATGAVGLYQRFGFAIRETSVAQCKSLA